MNYLIKLMAWTQLEWFWKASKKEIFDLAKTFEEEANRNVLENPEAYKDNPPY